MTEHQPAVHTASRIDEQLDGRPRWSRVDDATGDLLTALAGPGTDSEWAIFLGCVRGLAAEENNRINPNLLRPMLRREELHPRRVSSFYHRALLEGIFSDTPELWGTSTDTQGGNRGKPVRIYTYIAEKDTHP